MRSLKTIQTVNPFIFSLIIFVGCLTVFTAAGYITGYVWYNNLVSSISAEGGYACGMTPIIFLGPLILGIASGVVIGTSAVIVYLLKRRRRH